MLLSHMDNGRTQLLLPSTLNVAFRSFEPGIAELFPNEKLLRKKKIAATERTIFHWETAVGFTIQKVWMPRSMSGTKVTEYVQYDKGADELSLYIIQTALLIGTWELPLNKLLHSLLLLPIKRIKAYMLKTFTSKLRVAYLIWSKHWKIHFKKHNLQNLWEKNCIDRIM